MTVDTTARTEAEDIPADECRDTHEGATWATPTETARLRYVRTLEARRQRRALETLKDQIRHESFIRHSLY